MRSLIGLSLVTLILLGGCKEEPPPEPEPVEIPPKTEQEIANDYSTALQPLFAAAQPGSGFLYGMADPIIAEFNRVRGQYTNPKEINEPAAAAKIEAQLSNHIKNARDAEEWFALDGILRVHAILNPTSQRHQQLRRKCDLMMKRPLVKCTGFMGIDGNDPVSFLTITDPMTGASDSFKVHEGEEFYPDAEGNMLLRLVKIVGAQSAIELEYMVLPGETWQVPGPENR